MPIEFDWDEANIAHHDVVPHEAEEAIRNNPLNLGSRMQGGKIRITQLGRTNARRILLVVTTDRGHLLRVVTAYPARKKSQQVYLKHAGDL